VSVALFKFLLEVFGFVKKLLEPQFVGLVNDDEQHFIMLGSGAFRFLKVE
jgi:hypothetical protein